jgi:hypothetical protein
LIALLLGVVCQASAQISPSAQIPNVWDEDALRTLEIPLAVPDRSPVHISADYYYRIPVRPIYRSYPIYAPGREPAGYLDRLREREPEIVFDASILRTQEDWIRAGELVFDAPLSYAPLSSPAPNSPDYYRETGVRLAKEGTLPYLRYFIRKKGVIEVGINSCRHCHTRVMPDGSVVKGAQGNPPLGPTAAFQMRKALAAGNADSEQAAARRQLVAIRNFGVPWIQPDPLPPANSVENTVGRLQAAIPGVSLREGTNPNFPAQIPDLIGVKERHYLDHTGLVQHRSIADLMRYAALNQGAQLLAKYGDFIPAGRNFHDLPDPSTQSRYSDEQLYALALYLYSLKPPPNPNKFDSLAERGKRVFEREGAGCHTPPLYTNNRLTPVEGFRIPDEHRNKYDILPNVIGTDPNSAMKTRRGTGYYKVPSLKGVWYRGPFEHNGSVATLEDWFDLRRLRDDYVPTGFKPFGVASQAVQGHEFGLELSPEDKHALLAFLRTL